MQYFIIVFAILITDQLVKRIIVNNMSAGESIPVFDGLFHITYIRNHGAAFSFFSGHAFLLGAFTGVLLAAGLVFIFIRRRSEDKLLMIAVTMITGGGIGNLIDRIMAGYVVDYLDFRVFPVFNIADICVTAGCALLFFSILRKEKS